MIYTDDHVGEVIINIGRPSFISDHEREQWRDINKWIEESPVPVKVNGMYWTMKEYLRVETNYLGSGFKYNFWFRSMEDLEQFEQKITDVFFSK